MSAAATTDLPANHPLPELLRDGRRVMLSGAPGTGKTTLATGAAIALAAQGQPCYCLAADPGLPDSLLPGAVCLAAWSRGQWQTQRMEALCTLDAARFRLPLVVAVKRLAPEAPAAPLVVDAPGVVRGAAAAELLPALAEAAGVQAVVALVPEGVAPPLVDEYRALGLDVITLAPAPRARRPARQAREQRRTALWNAYLAGSVEQALDVQSLPIVGMPPPRDAGEAWTGRQVGLLDDRGNTLIMGEVLALEETRLRVRAPEANVPARAIVLRDAHRRADGMLATAPRQAYEPGTNALPPDLLAYAQCANKTDGPHPVMHTGTASATLVNGVFGDPLLHVRLRHQRRSLLFDLGHADRLPVRTAHQVSDVFVSHAHFDHIGGFLWLLRARIGELPPCRLYGPPGLSGHVAGLVRGILWDRAGERGPRFLVAELHGKRLLWYRVSAGEEAPEAMATDPAPDGVLLQEPGLRVRATTLDHRTPVLAFAFEPSRQMNVRKERLEARGWPPGPWLGELKHRALVDDADAIITLPDGTTATADALAQELLLARPGQRLVYATDLADTPRNRERLTALARGAHTLVCEAPFLVRESDQAARTGHLTARACGEIALAAGVSRLAPFHFSRRHVTEAAAIYAEIRTVYRQAVIATPALAPTR